MIMEIEKPHILTGNRVSSKTPSHAEIANSMTTWLFFEAGSVPSLIEAIQLYKTKIN